MEEEKKEEKNKSCTSVVNNLQNLKEEKPFVYSTKTRL